MTAAIKVNPNTYAIGPSLYDKAWEKFEQRERKREARDAAFEEHFNVWRRFSYIDRERPNAQGRNRRGHERGPERPVRRRQRQRGVRSSPVRVVLLQG